MKIKHNLLFLALFLSGFYLSAQTFGGHPATIKWQQINTENVRVIFPEGMNARATRIVDVIEHVKANNTYSVGEKSKKIDLVLQTNQVISNGFVALAPYQSEFFGTSPQDPNLLGSADWLDLLSIHEYRHTLQFNNANRGLTKVLHILQGQAGWALGTGLSIPDWYFEGDATLSETLLTKAGRGRTPHFFKELRANLLNGNEYSYMVSRNGSFEKLLPNQYPLGYTLCNYTRNKHGQDVWAKILADAGRYRGGIYPFSKAMKRHTDKGTTEIYEEAYAQLKTNWKAELETLDLTPTQSITEKNEKTVTNYRFSQLLNDGSVVALKSSFKEIPHLVQIKDGKESNLTSYGIAPLPFLSENNGKLAWVELQRDLRRANRNYTRVVTYDMASGNKKYVTAKSKYFAPQVSAAGDRIVVVKADEDLQNNLVIINANDGSVIQEIQNPNNSFLSFPKWTEDDKAIVYINKQNSEMTLVKYDLATGINTPLTDPTTHTISMTDVVKNQIYFSSSFSGIDNIYTVNLDGNKAVKQISSVKIGAYEPTVSQDGKTLVIGEFTDKGYVLSKMEMSDANLAKADISYGEPITQDRYLVQTNPQEQDILDDVAEGNYDVKKYKGIFKGLRLHSWSLDQRGNNPSFDLQFDNTLRDFSANVGVLFNRNEKAANLSGSFSFGEPFAQIDLRGALSNRSVKYLEGGEVLTEKFKETSYSAFASVPLGGVKGNYRFSIFPYAGFTKYQTSDYQNEQAPRTNLDFGTATTGLSFSTFRKRASQNIQSRFALSASFEYQTSVNDIEAEKINASGFVMLPGISQNQGIKISAAYQKEQAANLFQFSDTFFYSRGYGNSPNDAASKISVDYVLPLAYPDWGFGGLIYFKRIRATLFYDLGSIESEGETFTQNSCGAEIYFDNVFFNVIPVTLGIRQSFLLNDDLVNPNRKSRLEFFAVNTF